MLGGASSNVKIGDIAASDAAQTGPEFFLTVDLNGIIGRGGQSSASLVNMQSQAAIAGLQEQQAVIDDAVAAQGLQIAQLGHGLRQADAGIAAAMALGGTMVVPDSAVSLSFNLATYRGEQGYSASIVGRLASKIYVNAGFGGSTRKGSNGGRVGVAFGF